MRAVNVIKNWEKNHHNDEYISNSSKLNSRIKGHSNAFGTICRILVTIS